MKEIEALSDTELRDELRTYSTNFGPITGTTRSVYEKKLAKLRKEGSKITVQTAPAKRTTSKSPARAPVAHFSSPIKSQKQISSRRKATRSESEGSSYICIDNIQRIKKFPRFCVFLNKYFKLLLYITSIHQLFLDESDSELSHVNAYTAPVKTKPISSTPEREYNPSNPVTPKSDVKTIKTITERRMTTSLPANDSVIGLRTELPSLKSDQPGATPPRKTAQPRTPPRSTRVTTTAYSLSGPTSSTRNKTSLLDRGQTIGSHGILDLGNTTGEEEDEDEGQETSRIIYNTNITGKEKRSPIRKAWDKLLGFDFKAGAVPGTKYEMRHGSTRTKVERDLRTGRIRVQQQSVGSRTFRDVSTVLMITLAIFLCLLAVAYLGTARQEVIAATTTAFTGAVKDTVQFFYKYAVLPTFIIFGVYFFVLYILSAAVLVLSIYYGHKKWQLMKEKEEAEFYDLVDRILDIIRESALDGEEYISVPHVRDLMFTPAKRRGAELARWERAVDFINANESRVATETRVMRGGQECAVWKWLPSKKTGWQGSAFSSAFSASPMVSPLSSNIPTEALTRCLKVREMFTKDEDDDVDVNAIERAIKEKVYPVRPVHVSVDTTSNDGVVFMKLANKDDAKQSFTALHGVWFNG
uniref:LEM domain-containing protein n=1 Tax=Heterorhabditis bacteriophora TaxID=37862 RepID=A0A1I7XL03_HETBA